MNIVLGPEATPEVLVRTIGSAAVAVGAYELGKVAANRIGDAVVRWLRLLVRR